MKIPHQYILLFLFLFVGQMVYAQVDPIRAALFLKLKKESNKNINATQGALGVKWASHRFVKSEQEKITKFQRKFNKYLSDLDTAFTYAADIYALYNEVQTAKESLSFLKKTVSVCPQNVAAVALSQSKNSIYKQLIQETFDVLSNIKVIYWGRKPSKPQKKEMDLPNLNGSGTTMDGLGDDSDVNDKNITKMSVYERFEMCDKVRGQLRQINRKLRALAILVRSTSLLDIWYETTGKVYKPKAMKEIADLSFNRWKSRLKSLNNYFRTIAALREKDWKDFGGRTL